ncbi:MAG: DUF6036 family nucleotidyltransferase [Myxococcota bacterium]
MFPRRTIEAFDEWLAARSLRLDAIVVGGSALALLGVTDRQTRDFDILHPELPAEIIQTAREFAAQLRSEGVELADDWLNNGPMQLVDVLPDAWRQRVRVAFRGASLTLKTLGRSDLLKTKLFALCDRGTDLADCMAMSPSSDELEEAGSWLCEQDAYPMWPNHVRATLDDLRGRLGHGV